MWNLIDVLTKPFITPALYGGILLGYVMYDVTHYYTHHGKPSKGIILRLKVTTYQNELLNLSVSFSFVFPAWKERVHIPLLFTNPFMFVLNRDFTWIITSEFGTKDLESLRLYGTLCLERFLLQKRLKHRWCYWLVFNCIDIIDQVMELFRIDSATLHTRRLGACLGCIRLSYKCDYLTF